MRRNPIRNAVIQITKRDLVTCNICGCPDLAWVKYKNGGRALVETRGERPLWRGEGPAPEGIYALKFAYHRCEEYIKTKLEAERRASDCHPKADKPREILADAICHIMLPEMQEFPKFPADHPLVKAVHILVKAQSDIQELPKGC